MVSIPMTLRELERRLTALASARQDPDDGASPTDEDACFRMIDALDSDASASGALAEVGQRFADRFVAPYLHANDLRGVLTEVDGLLAIHRRGRLRVDLMDEDAARVAFQKLGDDLDRTATTFDAAVVTHAIRTRFPDARIEPEPEGDTSYTFWRIRAR